MFSSNKKSWNTYQKKDLKAIDQEADSGGNDNCNHYRLSLLGSVGLREVKQFAQACRAHKDRAKMPT